LLPIVLLATIALIIVAVVVTVVESRACERMLKAMVLLEVLISQRYPLVVDINSQAAFSKFIKVLDVFVDVIVSTLANGLRASDDVGASDFRRRGVVVVVVPHHHHH